jgi:hypothetical protein
MVIASSMGILVKGAETSYNTNSQGGGTSKSLILLTKSSLFFIRSGILPLIGFWTDERNLEAGYGILPIIEAIGCKGVQCIFLCTLGSL